MTPDEIKGWLLVALAVWNAGLTLVVWLRKPGEDASHAVDKLREDMVEEQGKVNTRLTAIETELEHMPTSEELTRLEGTVKAIDMRTEGQSRQIETMANAVNRIENYLLNNR